MENSFSSSQHTRRSTMYAPQRLDVYKSSSSVIIPFLPIDRTQNIGKAASIILDRAFAPLLAVTFCIRVRRGTLPCAAASFSLLYCYILSSTSANLYQEA
jgi:hypothetical protein